MKILPFFYAKLGSSSSETARVFTETDSLWFTTQWTEKAGCNRAGLMLAAVTTAASRGHYRLSANRYFFQLCQRGWHGFLSEASRTRIEFAA